MATAPHYSRAAPQQGDSPHAPLTTASTPPNPMPPMGAAPTQHFFLTPPPKGDIPVPSPGTGSIPPNPLPQPLTTVAEDPIHTVPSPTSPAPATQPLPITAQRPGTARTAEPLQTTALFQALPDMPLPIPARSDGSAGLPAPAMPSAHTLPPTPLPDLVARQILPNLGTTGAVTVTLSPVELGTLVFEVSPRADGLHLHLTVETPATLDLLRRQGDQILAELRQAGFANASLSFAGQDGQPGTDPRQGQAGNDRTPDAAPELSPQPPGHLPPRSLTATPGTLDLRL
ncbi:MAG: flagellar hook-length control protein FliK [Rhodobacteraceae bacterium]|nr:flagellar hook-length control protein FliK [Paracoccaceae bacterium]